VAEEANYSGNKFHKSGKHFALSTTVQRGEKFLVVVDGKAGEEFDHIGKAGELFSPDSQRVAYWAKRGKRWHVVVDGVEGGGYDSFTGRLEFASPKSIHALAIRGKELFRLEIEIPD